MELKQLKSSLAVSGKKEMVWILSESWTELQTAPQTELGTLIPAQRCSSSRHGPQTADVRRTKDWSSAEFPQCLAQNQNTQLRQHSSTCTVVRKSLGNPGQMTCFDGLCCTFSRMISVLMAIISLLKENFEHDHLFPKFIQINSNCVWNVQKSLCRECVTYLQSETNTCHLSRGVQTYAHDCITY